MTKLYEELKLDSDDVLTMINGESGDIPSSPTTASKSPPCTAVKLRRTTDKVQKSLDELNDIIDVKSLDLRRRLDRIFDSGLMQAELSAERAVNIEDLVRLNDRKKG